MTKKIVKKIFIILGIVILGGLGGIIMDRYLFPYLSMTSLFANVPFLKKSTEDVTVINRTEQVTVKETTSMADIANQAASSVVNIIVLPGAGQPTAAVENITGEIVTSDGLIMTYAPDLTANSKYKVLLYDGSVDDATFVGVDAYSNLTFLKIDASNLPVISFGDSSSIEPGEKVVAIGNASGSYLDSYDLGMLTVYMPTFNLGGGTVSSSEKMEGVYDTDFGNPADYVGGPVVDFSGQTIGILGSINVNDSQEYFVIPADKVEAVVNKAIDKEIGSDPVLGIYYVPITKTFALANNLNVNGGAMIYSASGQQGLAIIYDSSAQKAGLKMNDIITAVNGTDIDLSHSLPDLLYAFKTGDKIKLTVDRNGQMMKIPVQL